MSDDLRNRYFDQEATTWSNRYRLNRHFQARLDIALRLMPSNSRQLKLVDYGCGSGVLMRKLLEIGHSVTGIDASPQMIEQAQRNVLADSSFVGRFSLVQAEEFNLPEANPPWDGIFCLGVLEYIEDPFALLRKFSEVLSPDGFLLMSYPNKRSFLRSAERAVYRNPRIFRALGMFPHLTSRESYLRHQRHQFAPKYIDDVIETYGLTSYSHAFHVAPRWLGPLASNRAIGMTVISSYRKTPVQRAGFPLIEPTPGHVSYRGDKSAKRRVPV